MSFILATMRLVCTPPNAQQTQPFRDRFTPAIAAKWALMTFPSGTDMHDAFTQLLEADCLAMADQDIPNATIVKLEAFSAWHSVGGYHSSGTVTVMGLENNNASHVWTFNAGVATATMKVEAGYWTLEVKQ
jgi:hypothetical protein